MDLYLIRHADAVPLGERNITQDALRPLTDKGKKQSKIVARGLQKREVTFEQMLASPLLRAQQTARIILDNWKKPVPEIVTCEELVPDAAPKTLAPILGRLKAGSVALVGHMPHLADFAAWLIGSRKAQIDMAKAGVALITCDSPPAKGLGVLRWLVTLAWLQD